LDSKERLHSLDKRGMLDTVGQMPKSLSEGVALGKRIGLARFSPSKVIVCGMGGSAIGGDLLCEWVSSISDVPCGVHRSYSVPSHLNEDSLVIVASYSGNTEETLNMFEDAMKKKARIVAVTSGGELARNAERLGIPCAKVPSGMVPRASLGFMLGAMIGILERIEMVSAGEQIEDTVRVLKGVIDSCKPSVKTIENPAKRLAHELMGHVPVVVGYGISRPVAKRWANQLNENAKVLAFSSEIPELNHNEIVGWMKDGLSRGFAAIILDSEQGNMALTRRVEATKNMLTRVASVHRVKSLGRSPLAQLFSLVLVGDYVSAYLGILRGEDPSTNEPIDELKSVLAKK
jgi:glucose/mannose-6-phosphate isomerase